MVQSATQVNITRAGTYLPPMEMRVGTLYSTTRGWLSRCAHSVPILRWLIPDQLACVHVCMKSGIPCGRVGAGAGRAVYVYTHTYPAGPATKNTSTCWDNSSSMRNPPWPTDTSRAARFGQRTGTQGCACYDRETHAYGHGHAEPTRFTHGQCISSGMPIGICMPTHNVNHGTKAV